MNPVLSGRVAVDWGRIVVVPLFIGTLLLNLLVMVRALHGGLSGLAVACSVLASAGTIAFQVLVILAYLRRGPATATTASASARVAAVVATWLPLLVLPWLGTGRNEQLDVAASVLIAMAMGLALWSVTALGTNISVFAQTRQLAERGPYRLVRHPLYLAEVIAVAGITLHTARLAAVSLVAVMAVLQAFRAAHEERLLVATLPGYLEYRQRTAQLIPRVL